MTIRHVLPLVLLAIGCGPEARIHEPQQAKQDSSISLAAVSDVSEWSEPVNLGAVNSPFNDIAPEISKDRLSLYFASNRPGGLGANDIYVSRRASVDDPWGPPINLGPPINSAVADAGPHLSRDGHWLFFTSARAGGAGGNDLYVSYRKNTHDDFAWESPVNVGPPVNSALSDVGPSECDRRAAGRRDSKLRARCRRSPGPSKSKTLRTVTWRVATQARRAYVRPLGLAGSRALPQLVAAHLTAATILRREDGVTKSTAARSREMLADAQCDERATLRRCSRRYTQNSPEGG